jgi:hypothetical protein
MVQLGAYFQSLVKQTNITIFYLIMLEICSFVLVPSPFPVVVTPLLPLYSGDVYYLGGSFPWTLVRLEHGDTFAA